MASKHIQADFDRLAALEEDGWNHNNHYHAYLLCQIPDPCDSCLDIGCGAGVFARLVAGRAGPATHVVGLDLSPEMIAAARARSQAYPNLEFVQADVLAWPFPPAQYGCIVTIATLHHLPLETALEKMKAALKPGGVLLVLDLFRTENLSDFLLGLAALPANVALSLIKTGRLRQPYHVRKAWTEHARHDQYPRLSDIRRVCVGRLPGAKITRHLLWRYSLVWAKPLTQP
jgi:ubiquinone/menaquinone biosynthesis C-methylase UbiE